MASYELSGRADRDLTEIYRYSFEEFGEAKADAYLLALDDCLTRLASSPELGRSAERLRPGYFRFEQASHVVFYVKAETASALFASSMRAWTRTGTFDPGISYPAAAARRNCMGVNRDLKRFPLPA